MANLRYEYWNTFDSEDINIYGSNWATQIFISSGGHTVAFLRLKLHKTGTPDFVTVSIQGIDIDGKPNGTDLTTEIVNASAFSTASIGNWETITFSTVITLSPNTKYAIVVRYASGDASNYISWRVAEYDSSGPIGVSTDSGSTWTLDITDVALFEVWGSTGITPQDKQSNQMISATALGYWSTEDQVYSVTGMSSTIVQKMMSSGKTATDVTNLINGYIQVSDQRIRHQMGIPYTIRKEYHVFHFNEQFRQMGPFEDEYEFFDYYDPTNRVEKVFAIYSNKRRLKYPFPKNCDDLTEDTVVVSQESSIDGMEWDTDDLPHQILFTFASSGYISCIDGDVGKPVLVITYAPSNPSSQWQLSTTILNNIGTLLSYDNSARTWIVSTGGTLIYPFGSKISLMNGGIGAGTLSIPSSDIIAPTTLITQDTSDFMAGKASLKVQVTNPTGGVVIFPMTRNLIKAQYPWDYLAFWMKTDTPNASFIFKMYDVRGWSVNQQFYCGSTNFNLTLGFNPALFNTWQIVALKFMLMQNYAGGANWVFTPVQYFTIEVDRPCVFHIDNLNWNDGIFFTAPKGYLCWSRSEISAIADELEVTYCLIEGTEVLTKSGWKHFKDLSYDDEVATLTKDGYLEYQKPTEIINQDYKGEMLYYHNKRKYDFMVTPNHKLFIASKDVKTRNFTDDYKLIEADKINNKYFRVKTDAKWVGKNDEWFYLPIVEAKNSVGINGINIGVSTLKIVEKIPMKIWLRFLGWYLSEGSCTHSDKVRDYVISIYQKDKEYNNEIKETIKNMGFNCLSYDENKIRINSKQLYNYLNQFGKSHDKFVPDFIKELSPEFINIFLDAYIKGDGSIKKNGLYKSISTVSKRMADDLTELLLKSGRSSNLNIEEPKTTVWNGKPMRSSTMYRIHIRNEAKQSVVLNEPEKIKYNGKVYCCTVPNHVIYIRRNGRYSWTGNSFDPFKQEVPIDISIGSAKMAGILLLEYLIGIRQRATAFTQSSDALATSPDKETLEFTKARLEREVEEFLSGIGFKAATGFSAEG